MVDNSSTSSSKKRFAIKLFAFLLLLVVLDAGIGGILRVFYFKQTSGLNYRTTYAMDQSTEDIIILGSSRAQANYVPTVFKDVLGASCYNAGRDGQTLLYSHAVQQAIFVRHKPQILILDLIATDFYFNGPHYDKLSALLPYYYSHQEIQKTIQLRSKFERIKLLSRIYPFNSLPLQIFKYNVVNGKERDGHVAQYGELELPLPDRVNKTPSWIHGQFDPNMIHALKTLTENCKNHNVTLIVVVSPVYEGTIPGRAALPKVADIIGNSPFVLWDYSDYPEIINNPKLFRDKGHLNNVGAQIFTGIIVDRIAKEITSGT